MTSHAGRTPSAAAPHRVACVSRAASRALALVLAGCHWSWPSVRQSTPRRVFALYALSSPAYGVSRDGMLREIDEARAIGLDGFALTMTAWPVSPSNSALDYRARARLMYDAAEARPGFQLYLAPDFCCSLRGTNVADIYAEFAARPSQLRRAGRLVVSGVGAPADGTYWQSVRASLRARGTEPFVLPSGFATDSPQSSVAIELPTMAQAQALFDRLDGAVDGYVYNGQAGAPDGIAAVNDFYAGLFDPSAMLYVAPVAPSFWGGNQRVAHYRYFEYAGGVGAARQWGGLIAAAQTHAAQPTPQWVLVTTWNDFASDTHVAPLASPPSFGDGSRTVRIETHAGMAALFGYYVRWFKTGAPPPIAHDAMVYAYRTQSIHATATLDTTAEKPTLMGARVEDEIVVTTLLTAPAELWVHSGAAADQRRAQPAGLSTVRLPFSPGAQRFELRRGDATVLAGTGAEIDARPERYNASVYSGLAGEI